MRLAVTSLYVPFGTTNQVTVATVTAGSALSPAGTFASTAAGWGAAIANLGDIDSNSWPDLAIGAPGAAGGAGIVYVVRTDSSGNDQSTPVRIPIPSPDGTVNGRCGSAIATVGDLTGDGVADIFIGCPGATVGGVVGAGAVYYCNIKPAYIVTCSSSPITATVPQAGAAFGSSIAQIGDLNHDGRNDIAIGSPLWEPSAAVEKNQGCIYIGLTTTSGTFSSLTQISSDHVSWDTDVWMNGLFGSAITALGDQNYDSVPDIAVGMSGDITGGVDIGAFLIVFLTSTGDLHPIMGTRRFSAFEGSRDLKLNSTIKSFDRFGSSLARIKNPTTNKTYLAVGAPGFDGGHTPVVSDGALFILKDMADVQCDGPPVIDSFTPTTAPFATPTVITISGRRFQTNITVVSISETPCSIVSLTYNKIECRATNIYGLSDWLGYTERNITLVTGGFSSVYTNDTYLTKVRPPFVWGKPTFTLTSVLPGIGAGIGGGVITVKGAGFGVARGPGNLGTEHIVVTANTGTGPVDCNATTVLVVDDSTIICYFPTFATAVTGNGMTVNLSIHSVVVTQSGAWSWLSAPTIISVTPTQGDQMGGDLVTITGTFFGPISSGPALVVTTDEVPCTGVVVLDTSGTTLRCTTTDAGVRFGKCKTVTVSVDGALAVKNITWGWVPKPKVFAVYKGSDCCTARGGYTITISGDDFDTTANGLSNTQVYVGSKTCSSFTIATVQTIYCVVPPGVGKNLDVWVKLLRQRSDVNSFFTYDAPRIDSWTPYSMPTVANKLLTINGPKNNESNFGQPGDVRSIMVGSTNCTNVNFGDDWDTLTCTVQPGIGYNLSLSVTIGGQTTTVVSAFNFEKPVVQSITPSNGSTDGGFNVSVYGLNFGTFSNQIEIRLDGINLCETPLWINDTLIKCLNAPKGTGKNYNVTVNVGSQFNSYDSSNPAVVFSYLPPVVWNITYKQDPLDKSTIYPLTDPGIMDNAVTIEGYNLGYDGVKLTDIQVILDEGKYAKNCTIKTTGACSGNPSLNCSTDVGYSSIKCQVPAGTGSNLSVVVRVKDQYSEPFYGFQYSKPVLSYFDFDTSKLTNKAGTVGGAFIVINGQFFGKDNTSTHTSNVVYIGGTPCSPTAHINDQVLTCIVPAGVGASLNVTAVVDGQVGLLPYSFSYFPPTFSDKSTTGIAPIQPPWGPVSGGINLTLTGDNFGFDRTNVSITLVTDKHEQDVSIIAPIDNHQVIIALMPAGIGQLNSKFNPQLAKGSGYASLVLNVGGQVVSSPFAYYPCANGSVRNEDGNFCSSCLKGTFNHDPTSFQCTSCPVSQYGPNASMAYCLDCPQYQQTAFPGGFNLTNCSCIPTYYGVDGQNCTACPFGGACPGGNSVYPAAGYWGTRNFLQTFYACTPAEACPGNFSCADGFDQTSRLCSNCLPGYSMKSGLCLPCPSYTSMLAIAVVGGVLGFLIVSIVMKSKSLTQLKIFMSFAVTESSFHDGATYDIKWPDFFSNILSSFKSFISIDAPFTYGMECFGEIQLSFFSKFMLPAILPPVAAVALILWYYLYTSTCGRRQSKAKLVRFKNRCVRNMLFVIFLSTPAVSQRISSLYQCVTLDQNQSFLASDLSQPCEGEEYRSYQKLGFIIFAIYPAGVPIVIWIFLNTHKKEMALSEPNFLDRYGFLYHEYKKKWFWWETVEMLRKVFFTTALPLMQMWDKNTRIAIVAFVSAVFLALMLSAAPFKDEMNNFMMAGALINITLTAYGGLMLRLQLQGVGGNEIVYMLIATIFGSFLATFTMLAKQHIKSFRESIQRFKDWQIKLRARMLTPEEAAKLGFARIPKRGDPDYEQYMEAYLEAKKKGIDLAKQAMEEARRGDSDDEESKQLGPDGLPIAKESVLMQRAAERDAKAVTAKSPFLQFMPGFMQMTKSLFGGKGSKVHAEDDWRNGGNVEGRGAGDVHGRRGPKTNVLKALQASAKPTRILHQSRTTADKQIVQEYHDAIRGNVAP
eukprot:GILJ01005079.1.p1 GENE.GILJ01005079.1~~GILJ01005079.1.p1  ORF type:complete len:2182 (+),score=318.67 GILJ01005079.1:605-6547(+)